MLALPKPLFAPVPVAADWAGASGGQRGTQADAARSAAGCCVAAGKA